MINDFLQLYVEGNILKTFLNMFEVVIALDLVTLVCMIFARAKNDI